MIEKLGTGGNGTVYKVKEKETEKFYALKQIKFNKSRFFNIKYKRFKREINVIVNNTENYNFIIPIIDKYLPKNPNSNDIPYFVMEIATPIEKVFSKDSSIIEVVKYVLTLAKSLEILHNRNIVHRDIKPSNLYIYNEIPSFGDFGLVDYPGSEKITDDRESVGAKYTIAPEMKRNAKYSDGKSADVYSLAKTLWMLLSWNFESFEGQYNHKIKDISLAKYRVEKDNFLSPLHITLAKATENNPSDRLNIKNFIEELEEFIIISEDNNKINEFEWNFLLNNVFRYGLPVMAKWDKTEQIIAVLKELSYGRALNHTFMPDGGGLDFTDIALSNEVGYVEINFDGSIHKLKPKYLTLYTFKEMEWNYFYMATEDISKLDIYNSNFSSIDVVENGIGVYIKHFNWYYKRNMEEANKPHLLPTARTIRLGLKGNYVIFSKYSPYNLKIPSSYNGYQSYFSEEAYYKLISDMKDKKISIKKLNEYIYAKNDKDKKIEKENLYISDCLTKFNIHEIPNAHNEESYLVYYISIFDSHIQQEYYLSKNSSFELLEQKDEFDHLFNEKDYSSFLDLTDIHYISELQRSFEELVERLEIIENKESHYGFKIEIKRIKSPSYIFTLEDIKKEILVGDSFKHNYLVIDAVGKIKLINEKRSLRNLYPVEVTSFNSEANEVGEFVTYDDDMYNDFYLLALSSWLEHLELGKRVVGLYDFISNQKEEELIDKIRKFYL